MKILNISKIYMLYMVVDNNKSVYLYDFCEKKKNK